MSAILSSEDLNDFISPGVACIKPVETLPKEENSANPYEVTTEDKIQHANAPPASISLTDCLACSGCVTSAEAVLISLQSHNEVINTLDSYPSIDPRRILNAHQEGLNGYGPTVNRGKLFVASVSPQVRASLAATYGVSERQAGNIIDQLLRGSKGLGSGGQHGSKFTYVVDTNTMRQACLVLGTDEAMSPHNLADAPSRPILTSACPGWICYAEKTHPHVLPHLSRLKSPQALTGTLLKSVLSRTLNLHPSQIWHLAVMPCFDKKLEASREELTDRWWQKDVFADGTRPPVRDVDCVITARELLTLANERGIAIHELPRTPVRDTPPFPDPTLQRFFFPNSKGVGISQSQDAGSSGGFMYHTLKTHQALNPGSTISVQRGRNADVTDYILLSPSGEQIMKCARFYGFRNIQNLVRKLKPARASRLPGASRKINSTTPSATSAIDYSFVEVMACPGGCTNGGGQIKIEDVQGIYASDSSQSGEKAGPQLQRDWLKHVDEAYFSASSDSDADLEGIDSLNDETNDVHMEDVQPESDADCIDGISASAIHSVLQHWSSVTDIPLEKLVFTSYRKVESDVGKSKSKGTGDMERVAGIASSIGGGW